MTPNHLFDILFQHIYDLPDWEHSNRDGGTDEVSSILRAAYTEARNIREEGYDAIDPLGFSDGGTVILIPNRTVRPVSAFIVMLGPIPRGAGPFPTHGVFDHPSKVCGKFICVLF